MVSRTANAPTNESDREYLVEDYPDRISRELNRLATEPRSVADSALPPRHLDAEKFPTTLVDRNLIVSGGPPPDGIPAIDDPQFAPAGTIDFAGR